MAYEKRLFNALHQSMGLALTPDDFARLWKRQKLDVVLAANNLKAACMINIDAIGVLSLKENINVA